MNLYAKRVFPPRPPTSSWRLANAGGRNSWNRRRNTATRSAFNDEPRLRSGPLPPSSDSLSTREFIDPRSYPWLYPASYEKVGLTEGKTTDRIHSPTHARKRCTIVNVQAILLPLREPRRQGRQIDIYGRPGMLERTTPAFRAGLLCRRLRIKTNCQLFPYLTGYRLRVSPAHAVRAAKWPFLWDFNLIFRRVYSECPNFIEDMENSKRARKFTWLQGRLRNIGQMDRVV